MTKCVKVTAAASADVAVAQIKANSHKLTSAQSNEISCDSVNAILHSHFNSKLFSLVTFAPFKIADMISALSSAWLVRLPLTLTTCDTKNQVAGTSDRKNYNTNNRISEK